MNLEQMPLSASAPVIKTNHQFRPVLRWYELNEKEKAEFDYLETANAQEWAEFVRYKCSVYHLQDTMAINPRFCLPASSALPLGFQNWDAYINDSFFSGVLFKYSADCEYVKCGFYYS